MKWNKNMQFKNLYHFENQRQKETQRKMQLCKRGHIYNYREILAE